jgi:hypothetical protein
MHAATIREDMLTTERVLKYAVATAQGSVCAHGMNTGLPMHALASCACSCCTHFFFDMVRSLTTNSCSLLCMSQSTAVHMLAAVRRMLATFAFSYI